ncbi:MAG TPA: hypothetical protein DIT13_13820, partial [Verrucomicrobiales bacterium]|nr:hypothetical protein [Verrucomicrobiales bacterium]
MPRVGWHGRHIRPGGALTRVFRTWENPAGTTDKSLPSSASAAFLAAPMLTSETKRRIDSCRDILVGKLPLPTDQVELITLALIYKFMDDLDEESVEMGGKRSFFTQHLEPYRWRNLLPQTVSAEQRMSLFARGIELLGGADMEIEVKEKGEVKKKRIIPAAHLPGLFRDVFRNAFLKFRDGRILTLFLTEVNAFAYSHSEELGNAFEYLLQCMGTQGENGQFRTPRHIIDFVVACLDPQPGDRILDPACGTGGFLVSAYKHILSRHTSAGSSLPGDQLTHEQRQQVYANLTGYDITDLMVKLSKVNLFLHGFPDPAIHIYDTLSNDARWEEKADLILANPPFMTPKGGVTPHTKFRIAAKKAEVLFTDYIAEHLSSAGRGGVIVPNGIVATTQNAYVKLRRFLVEDCLVAVVSLPSGVFKPYSGVKTSILFFDKQLARKTKEVLFLKITADGFDLGDQRREIEANDLPEAERVLKAWLAGQTAGEGAGGAEAEGAGFRAKGPSSSQPGPTAQEPGTKTRQGLKARSMPAAVPLAHEPGLQPSAVIADDTPGALPQAGMGSAVGAAVVWRRVEKSTLLESRACSLQAETFFGEPNFEETTHAKIALGEFCRIGGSIKKDIDKTLPYIGSDSIESGTGRLTQRESCEKQGIQGPVYEFAGPCLLYSKIRPYLNKLTITDFHGYCSSDIYPLKVDETKALPSFVMFNMLSSAFLDSISEFHERVSIPKINREQLRSEER